MFVIDISDTFYWPVTVEVPVDGGQFKKSQFDAEFKRLSRDEQRAYLERIPVPGKDIENPVTDDELLEAVFVGWKGVKDQQGNDVPYSETTRNKLLNVQGVAKAILMAWWEVVQGNSEQEKN